MGLKKKKVNDLNLVFSEYVGVFRAFFDVPKQFILPFFFDFLFIVCYLFISSYFNEIIGETLKNMQQFLLLNAQDVFSRLMSSGTLMDLFDTFPVIKEGFYEIIKYSLISSVLIFFIYIAFQFFSWKFSLSMLNKKVNSIEYFKRFLYVNIFWFFCVFIINMIPYIFNFLDMADGRIQGIPTWVRVMIRILSFSLVYFAFISYITINSKDWLSGLKMAFSSGIIHILLLGFAFFLILATLLVSNTLINLFSAKMMKIILESFVVIPLIGIMRIYFIKVNKLIA
jgi:hypothetical protein